MYGRYWRGYGIGGCGEGEVCQSIYSQINRYSVVGLQRIVCACTQEAYSQCGVRGRRTRNYRTQCVVWVGITVYGICNETITVTTVTGVRQLRS